MTPPETPDDAPLDSSDQSYERVFADLFRRFWRDPTRAQEPEPGATASTEIPPQD